MIKVGDRISVRPVTFDVHSEERDGKKRRAITGTVEYIHPARRFCVITFEVGRFTKAIIRESFQLVNGEVLQE